MQYKTRYQNKPQDIRIETYFRKRLWYGDGNLFE